MRHNSRTWQRFVMMAAMAVSLVSRNTPSAVQAALSPAAPVKTAPAAPAANPGITYKLVYNNSAGVYEVYMKPDTTLAPNYQIGYAQVTIKAPVGFIVSAGPTATAGVNWNIASTNRAADTGLPNDYFGIEPTTFPNNTPTFTANTEVKMFTFQAASCLGALSIINNATDPIMSVPSLSPGNSVIIDPSYGELYSGNYAGPDGLVANCAAPDLTTTIGQPAPNLIVGQTSSLPITVTNSGSGAATGPLTVTLPLPTGITAPASFNNNGWVCSTSGQTATCTNAGPLNSGTSSGFSVPVTPNAGAVGTQPTFNAAVAPAPNETNTANNAATPLTTTPPVSSGTAPVISVPAAGSTTNDTTPTIVGTADANSAVTVYRAGSPICNATTDASGNWSCTPSVALPQGATTVTATAVLGSYTSPVATRSFTIDATAPTAPTVLTPTENLKTPDNTPLLNGTAEPGSTVTVKEGSNVLCTAVADASGNWACTSTPLSDGPHTVLTTATDPAGNTSPAAVRNFTVDTVAPNAPVINTPAANALLNTATPSISGQAEPNSTVTVKEGTTTLCTATTDGAGNWACTPTAPLAAGAHSITATSTDAAGNPSAPSAARPFTVDVTAPGTPTISAPTAGSTSSSSTPTISGQAEPGSTVAVKEGTTSLCTAVADALGNWSCTSAALSNGPHTVSATATDPSGNTSPAATRSFNVNNTAPAINTPAANSTVSTTTPLFSGTGTPSGAVTVKEGATTICTATADASGNWSCTASAPLAQGNHSVVASVLDGLGNTTTSAAQPFKIDSLAPAAPTISAPTTGSTTNDNTPTVSGTAEPGSTVAVSEGGQPLCSAVADASGNWTCTPITPLAEGPHAVSATATDPAGNPSPPTTRAFNVDTVAPTAPVVTSPSPSDVLSDTTPTVTGTGEPGATVTVKDGPGGPVLCTATVSASGAWSCTPTTPMSEGPHTLSVSQADPAGNTSPTTSVPVTIDSGVPAAPTINSPAAGSTTNDNTPTISGSAEPNSKIVVKEGTTTLCTATTNASGAWTCDSSTLADGLHTVSTTATDAAGNTSPTATRAFTVDSTAPAAPALSTPTSGQTTNDNTPQASGTAEPGSTVAVKEGATTLCTTIADSSGNWSCSPATPLSDGAHSITATSTDPAGNISPASPARSFTVDTTAPAAPVIALPTAGSTTSDSTPTISGSAEPNSAVTVKEGATTVCITTTDASGNWTCDASPALSNGSHTVSATATDAAGNISPAASRQFSISNTAAAITAPTGGSVVSDTTPTFTGSGVPGGSVTVTLTPAGTPLCTATVDASGNWTCMPTTPLTEGPKTVQATVTNPGGSTTSPSVSFTVDSVAPAAPVINTPAANSSTNDNTPGILGTSEANATVTVRENGVTLCTTVADGSGNWSCSPTLPMADGGHTVSATATDAAGNTSPAATRAFTVDTTAPSAPGVTTPAPNAQISTTTPAIGGTGEPGATVAVKDGTGPGAPTVCTALVQANGTWSCTPTPPLTESPHTLSVTQTDPAGNTSPPTTRPFTVDTTPPAAPAIVQPAQNAVISNGTQPALVGTSEPNASIVVKEGTTPLCTAIADAGGNWSCTPTTALSQGAHSITATSTDPAGNTGPASPARNFVIDTLAPAAPTVTTPAAGSTTSDNTPTVTGTAEPGSMVTVKENGAVLCSATTSASGSWTCDVSTPLNNGPHTLEVTAVDAGGNSSPAASRPFNINNTTPAILFPTPGSNISNTKPAIVGTGTPGAQVTITTQPTGTTLCTATVSASGNWSCTPTTPLPEGPVTMVAQISDPGGAQTTNPVTFTVDSQAPSAPVISTPAANAITSDNTPQISGTAEPNSTVKVTENGVLLCAATTNANGAWSCSPALPMAEGAHTVNATAIDGAGNVSPAAARSFSVDTQAPPVPTVSTPAPNGTTNDNTPLISGTGQPGATVTVKEGPTTLCTATVDNLGNWSCSPTAPLSEGPHSLSVTQTDPAGNTSPAATRDFGVDTAAPAAPVINQPTENAVLTTQTPTFSGTSEPNALVTVREGTTILCSGVANSSGAWSCTATLALTIASHSVTATATDAAGNVSPVTALRTFTIDTGAPTGNVDTDGDGISDVAEGSKDSDGDGIPDRLEPNNKDTDGDGLANNVDPDDDGDGIPTRNEDLNGNSNWFDDDRDGDGIPAFLDPNDATAPVPGDGGDSDGDGIADKDECPAGGLTAKGCIDSDGDGVPDYQDLDSDNDGIPDRSEGTKDSDGDGLPDRVESNSKDTDGDGATQGGGPNNVDPDDDGDGIPTALEDLNGNKNWLDDDKDGDGIPAYLDPNDAATPAQPNGGDSDGDGIPDNVECVLGPVCIDTDGDGKPDYLDPDSDNDGIPDATEGTKDTDGDGLPDRLENNLKDTDGDGLTNEKDPDDDGDGIPTAQEDLNGNKNWLDDDKDGDGIPAYLDPNDAVTANKPAGGDSDGDGLTDALECPGGQPCPDTDGDGKPDYLDPDSDGDGIPDATEGKKDTDGDGIPDRLESNKADTDGDGKPNQNDPDDDGDGIPTAQEDLNGNGNWLDDDKDGDGIPAYLDPNDAILPVQTGGGDNDGDGIPDKDECPPGVAGAGLACPDTDGDGKPDYLDLDSDNDGIPDATEGTKDTDGDGVPDRLENDKADTDGDGKPNVSDPDDDGDGIPTKDEDLNGDKNWQNDDKDGDGIPAYLDPNDSAKLPSGGDGDGDGIPDKDECPAGVACPDTDGNGAPDYLDTDSDSDDIPDAEEGTKDTDTDGIPDRLENNNWDTDGDGKPNWKDADDDGDGIPTAQEDLNGNKNWLDDDANKNGIPAYLDPNDGKKDADSDGDGIPDKDECPNGFPCPDTDKSGRPDYLDLDSDDDDIPDAVEGTKDTDGDGIPDRLENNRVDTDGDGIPNWLDADDDGDGIPTKNEDLNGDKNWFNDDLDKDGIPAYLDPNDHLLGSRDADGDGIPDKDECPGGSPCLDSDGDGVPDYLDTDSDGDGIPDATEGTKDTDGDGIPDRLENNKADTDGDGLPNHADPDDDGDGIPTKDEDLNKDKNWLNDDKDGDGIPAYLDPNDHLPGVGDTDGDGISDAAECPGGPVCPDTDGDGRPDYNDPDSDNDGIPDATEGTQDTDGDGLPNRLEPNNVDTDKDGKPNVSDPDDDGDGVPTKYEDLNHDGNWMNDDPNKNGVPAYLDPDDKKGGTVVDPTMSGKPSGQSGIPVIQGTGTPGATVNVTDNKGNPVCTATVGADGTWSCQASLPPGTHVVTAVSSDGSASVPTAITVGGSKIGIYLPIISKNNP